jgi:hypothetical protein
MTPSQRAPRRARTALIGIGAIGVLITGGCRLRPPADLSYGAQAEQALGRGQVPWFCHSQGLGDEMDHADLGGLADPAYAGRTKGDLGADDCRTVASMFDRTVAAVAKWPTRADAKRDGWYLRVPFIPGLGTHEQHPDLSRPGLDPERPHWLQYDGESDDAQLAGVSWVVSGPDRAVPPEGFPGANDWLHTHWSTCEGATDLPGGHSNEVPDDVCAAHGGTTMQTPGTWVIHAWIVKGYENRYDVFAGSSACLLSGSRPTADDPCHGAAVGSNGHAHDPGIPPHTHGTAPVPGTPSGDPGGAHGDHGEAAMP